MKSTKKSFIIAPVKVVNDPVSIFDLTSPWFGADVAFNISNYSYPTFHTHDYYEIPVVLSGSIEHDINGTTYTMHTGDCCLIRPNDRHRLRYATKEQSDSSFFTVNFLCKKEFIESVFSPYGPDALSLLDNTAHPTALSFFINHPMASRIERSCLKIQSPGVPQPHNVMICRGLICELISCFVQQHFSKNQSSAPAWLQDFIYTLQNPDNFSKHIHELIDGIPYSYSHVQKQFKVYMHTSIISYINSIKLAYARDMLLSTNVAISEIATTIGFESTAHFNHLFKDVHGITPAALRGNRKSN